MRRSRPSIAAHCELVADVAREVTRCIGGSEDDAQMAYLAGMLHDVGKLYVPERLLFGGRDLAVAEWRVLQDHAFRGEALVRDRASCGRLATIVGQHHERLDGRGYPRGLKARQIDPIARIVTVADAFAAMREERSYAQSRILTDVIAELRRGVDRQFEGVVVEALVAAKYRSAA